MREPAASAARGPWHRRARFAFDRGVFFAFARLPPLGALVIGWYYTLRVFWNLREDSTNASNLALAMLGTFAALSFSCARAVEPEARDRFAYAGERLLHGALMLAMASLFKYVILALKGWPYWNTALDSTVGMLINILTGVLFMQATMTAHTGVKVLNGMLIARMPRHSDWDDIL